VSLIIGSAAWKAPKQCRVLAGPFPPLADRQGATREVKARLLGGDGLSREAVRWREFGYSSY